MIINVHAGHNPDGKVACGAVGLIKESTEARKVTEKTIKLLKIAGCTVFDCTCNDGKNQSDVLQKIVAKCNAHLVDLDVSIHFNAGAKDKAGNGKTTGTEVLIYSKNGGAYDYADKICKAIGSLGFRNRGVKLRPDLYFLRKTVAPALLIEVCFVDDADDVKLYDADKVAQAIVRAITGKTITIESPTQPDAPDEPKTKVETFLVKVTSDSLYIRKGPSTTYSTVGAITDNGVYTIVEEQKGWGRLASGRGWISLNSKYVRRLHQEDAD